MQKHCMLFLMFCGNVCAMDPTSPRLPTTPTDYAVARRRDTNHAIAPEERRRMDLTSPVSSKVIIAAWIVTDQTPFEKYAEFCVSHNVNDTKSVTYTCRPKGKFLIPCHQKALLEISTQNNCDLTLLLTQHGEQFELTQLEEPWYKHPAITYGATALGTILVIASLFR